MLLERGFLRPRARRSRRRSAHRSRSSPIPPVTCVGRDSMSPPSSPTRTPSTAGGLRRGEGLRLLRWPTAPSSSMGSIRFSSGGAARRRGHVSGFPSSCAKARIWRTFCFQLYVLAPAEGLGPTSHGFCRYSDFAICSCGGISQICQWYRVCDAGALRAEPLATLYILRGQKRGQSLALSESTSAPLLRRLSHLRRARHRQPAGDKCSR